ncbi:MAG: class I SAM-dependent methyltransferase [bacterium]
MSFYSDFAEYYELVFPYRPVVHEFLTSHVSGTGRRILDIGCGTGHYCGRLAQAGHQVTGIDLDPEMITVASRTYPEVTFDCRDMLDIDSLAGPFHLVLCIGNVAAHLPTLRLDEFLAKLRRLLAPGGRWLFQTVNWDFVLGHESYRFPDRPLSKDGVVFQREYRGIGSESLQFITRLAAPDHTIFSGEVDLFPVRAAEYQRRHEAYGFNLLSHHADFKGSVFDPAQNSGSVFCFDSP